MFRFAAPWLLAALPLALLAAGMMARRRRRFDARLQLPGAALKIPLGKSVWSRLESTVPWLRGAVLLLIVLALARPQSGASIESVTTHGVDIVVSLDISGSMRAEDFKPDNRLSVARQTVQQFVAGRPSDRLGLVICGNVVDERLR